MAYDIFKALGGEVNSKGKFKKNSYDITSAMASAAQKQQQPAGQPSPALPSQRQQASALGAITNPRNPAATRLGGSVSPNPIQSPFGATQIKDLRAERGIATSAAGAVGSQFSQASRDRLAKQLEAARPTVENAVSGVTDKFLNTKLPDANDRARYSVWRNEYDQELIDTYNDRLAYADLVANNPQYVNEKGIFDFAAYQRDKDPTGTAASRSAKEKEGILGNLMRDPDRASAYQTAFRDREEADRLLENLNVGDTASREEALAFLYKHGYRVDQDELSRLSAQYPGDPMMTFDSLTDQRIRDGLYAISKGESSVQQSARTGLDEFMLRAAPESETSALSKAREIVSLMEEPTFDAMEYFFGDSEDAVSFRQSVDQIAKDADLPAINWDATPSAVQDQVGELFRNVQRQTRDGMGMEQLYAYDKADRATKEAQAKAQANAEANKQLVDTAYDEVSGRDNFAQIVEASDSYFDKLSTGTDKYNPVTGKKYYDNELMEQMTRKERIIWMGYRMEDEARADQFLDDIRDDLRSRLAVSDAERAAKFATEYPVLASILTIPDNAASAFEYPFALVAMAMGDLDAAYNFTREARDVRNVRGTVNSIVRERYGTMAAFWTEAGFNIADNLAAVFIGGGKPAQEASKAAQVLIQAIMSSEAGASRLVECIDNGDTGPKGVLLSLADFTAEWLTEKFSIEALLSAPQTGLSYFLKNFVTEGSEEIASNWVSRLLDKAIEGKEYELDLQYQNLISLGYEPQDALRIVLEGVITEDALAGLAGAMSGGIMAVGGLGLNSGRSALSNLSDARTAQELNAQLPKDMQIDAEEFGSIFKRASTGTETLETVTKKGAEASSRERQAAERLRWEADVQLGIQDLNDAEEKAAAVEPAYYAAQSLQTAVQMEEMTPDEQLTAAQEINDQLPEDKQVDANQYPTVQGYVKAVTDAAIALGEHAQARVDELNGKYGEERAKRTANGHLPLFDPSTFNVPTQEESSPAPAAGIKTTPEGIAPASVQDESTGAGVQASQRPVIRITPEGIAPAAVQDESSGAEQPAAQRSGIRTTPEGIAPASVQDDSAKRDYIAEAEEHEKKAADYAGVARKGVAKLYGIEPAAMDFGRGSGTATVRESGASGEIDNIHKSGDGELQVDLKGEDGTVTTHNLADVDVGDAATETLLTFLDHLGSGASAAYNLYRLSGETVSQFISDMQVAETYSSIGLSEAQAIRRGQGLGINPNVMRTGFRLAQTSRAQQDTFRARKAADRYDKVMKNVAPKATSNMAEFLSGRSDITPERAQGMQVLDSLIRAAGWNVNWTASDVDARGNRVGDNGSYDHKNNTITLDAFAGNMTASDAGIKLYNTAMHEMTHAIRAASNQSDWTAFKNWVLSTATEQNIALAEDITTKANHYYDKGRVSRQEAQDIAEEEAVAEACEKIKISSENLAAVAQQNPGLIEKIKSAIKDIVARLRDAVDKLRASSLKEAKPWADAMEKQADELDKRWNELFSKARENIAAAREQAVQEEASLSGDTTTMSFEEAGKLNETAAAYERDLGVTPELAEQMVEGGYQKPDGGMYSERTMDEWEAAIDELNDNELPEDMVKGAVDLVKNIVNHVLEDAKMRSYERHGKPGGNPIRSNVEYTYTFDMDTLCPRTYRFQLYREAVERRLGRRLSEIEARTLIEQMRLAGEQIPCTYCYVESKRMALSSAYNMYLDIYNAARSGDVKNAYKLLPASVYNNGFIMKNETVQDPITKKRRNTGRKVMTEASLKWKERIDAWASLPGTTSLNATTVNEAYRAAERIVYEALDARYAQDRTNWTEDESTARVIDGERYAFTDFSLPKGKSVKALAKEMCEMAGIEWRDSEKTGAQVEIEEMVVQWLNDVQSNRMHAIDMSVDTSLYGINAEALDMHHEAIAYASSSSQARKAENYAPYADQLLKIPAKAKGNINARGGFRIHSNNDYMDENLLDYIQFITHLALDHRGGVGWMAHAYTKNDSFAKLNRYTGMRVNMSIAMKGNFKTGITENSEEGMGWALARRERNGDGLERNPDGSLFTGNDNAGIMAMVTNDDQLSFALAASWIDMIIPFHASGMPAALYKTVMNWLDYTSIQSDAPLIAKEKVQRLLRGLEKGSPEYKRISKLKAAEAAVEYAARFNQKFTYWVKVSSDSTKLDEVRAKYEEDHPGDRNAEWIASDTGVWRKSKTPQAVKLLPGDQYRGGISAEDVKTEEDRQRYIDEGKLIPGFATGIDLSSIKTEEERNAILKESYLALCDQYGIRPRFSGTGKNRLYVTLPTGVDAKGNPVFGPGAKKVPIVQHPNYIKLLKETARMDSNQEEIKAEFDQAFIESQIKALSDENMKPVNTNLVNSFMQNVIGKNRSMGWVSAQQAYDYYYGQKAWDDMADRVEHYQALGVEGFSQQELRDMEQRSRDGVEEPDGTTVMKSERRDADYDAAVKRGDMETAQRLVDEKANEYLNHMLLPNDDDEVGFKYHRGKAPTHVIKRYAVFNVSPEGFKAAYAGNKSGTPVGVWLDAQNLKSYTSDLVQFDDGTFASYIPGDTGASMNSKFSPALKEQLLKEGLKASQNFLLERGGKHGTDVPNFSQMNLHMDENGNKVSSGKKGALPHNKLVFEIEYGFDEDLTDYVREHGRMMRGKNQGLKNISPNQYYQYQTNPNAKGHWTIGGTFRIKRLVPHSEIVSATEAFNRENNADVPLQKWVGGYHPEEFGLTVQDVDEMYRRGLRQKLTDAVTYDDNGNVIPLSERFNPDVEDARYSTRQQITPREAARNALARERATVSLTNTVKAMRKTFNDNNRDNHVPDVLKDNVGDIVAGIVLPGEERYGSKKQKDLYANLYKMAGIIAKLHEAQANPDTETKKGVESVPEFEGYLDMPQDIADSFTAVADKLQQLDNNTKVGIVSKLDTQDLVDLDRALKVVRGAVNRANSLIDNTRYRSVKQAGKDSYDFLSTYNDIKGKKEHGAAFNLLFWQNATPVYAFERFGDAGKSIFTELMDGQDKLARRMDEIMETTRGIFNPKQAKAWDEHENTFRLTASTAQDASDKSDVTMTDAQLMSLYALSKRPQGLQHIMAGGIRVGTIGTGRNARTDTHHYLVTEDDLKTMLGALSQEQKDAVDKMMNYMSTTLGEWGNEVTLKRFGVRFYTEDNYFPIRTDDSRRPVRGIDKQSGGLYRLLNMSFTQSLTPRANNAVILDSVTDVYADHAADMALYSTMALPTLDVMKWLNYRANYATVDENGVKHPVQESLAGEMDRVYGHEAVKYVTELVKSINGTDIKDRGMDFIRKMTGSFKVAAVGANLSVALLQPVSYVRAANVINPVYLAAALKHKPQVARMKQVTGIGLWKSQGNRDFSVSRGLTQEIKDTQTLTDKIREKSLWAAEKMDALTWGYLFNAVELELWDRVSRGELNVQRGTPEWDAAVNERFREIIYKTQVVDSVLTRSDLMRNRSGLMQLLTAFKAEPTVTANMMLDQVWKFRMDLQNGKTVRQALVAHAGTMARALSVYAAAGVAEALVRSLVGAFRDDDDYEDFKKKYLDQFKSQLPAQLNPFALVPVVSQLYESIVGGQDITVNAFNAPKAFYDAYTAIYNKIAKGSGTDYRVAYKTAQAVSYLTGIPFSSAMRDAVAAWDTMCDATGNQNLKLQTAADTRKTGTDALYDALAKGDDKKAADIRRQLKENGEDEKKVAANLRSNIKADFMAGEIDEAEAQRRLVQYTGMDDNDAYYKVTEYAYTAQGWGSFSKADTVVNAALSGDPVSAMREYAKRTGKTDKQATSEVWQRVRTLWQGGRLTDEEAIRVLTKACNFTRTEANAKLAEWKKAGK